MKSRQCIRLYTVPIFGVKKVEQGCFENGQSQTTRLCTIFRLFFEKIIWSFGTILSGLPVFAKFFSRIQKIQWNRSNNTSTTCTATHVLKHSSTIFCTLKSLKSVVGTLMQYLLDGDIFIICFQCSVLEVL